MTRLRASVRIVSLLLFVLPACDDGNGRSVELFFGMHNWNDCEAAGIVVDLEAAGAVLERNASGGPDCRSAMDEACDVEIVEEDDGKRLHVEIGNCFIDAYSNLASCRFRSARIRSLEAHTSATCDCESERRCILNREHCDVSPYLCIDTNPDPGSCEDCFNGRDDDGNGIVDCDDPNCSPSFECDTLGPTTTYTCTTNTMPTTTSSTSTTAVTLATEEAQQPAGSRAPSWLPADAILTAP